MKSIAAAGERRGIWQLSTKLLMEICVCDTHRTVSVDTRNRWVLSAEGEGPFAPTQPSAGITASSSYVKLLLLNKLLFAGNTEIT